MKYKRLINAMIYFTLFWLPYINIFIQDRIAVVTLYSDIYLNVFILILAMYLNHCSMANLKIYRYTSYQKYIIDNYIKISKTIFLFVIWISLNYLVLMMLFETVMIEIILFKGIYLFLTLNIFSLIQLIFNHKKSTSIYNALTFVAMCLLLAKSVGSDHLIVSMNLFYPLVNYNNLNIIIYSLYYFVIYLIYTKMKEELEI